MANKIYQILIRRCALKHARYRERGRSFSGYYLMEEGVEGLIVSLSDVSKDIKDNRFNACILFDPAIVAQELTNFGYTNMYRALEKLYEAGLLFCTDRDTFLFQTKINKFDDVMMYAIPVHLDLFG